MCTFFTACVCLHYNILNVYLQLCIHFSYTYDTPYVPSPYPTHIYPALGDERADRAAE